MNRLPACFAVVLCCWSIATSVRSDEPGVTRCGMATADGFRLEEFLGRTWRNEVVNLPLAGRTLAEAQANHALVTADGRSIPYQILGGADATEMRIAFAAALDPWQVQTYRFTADSANQATDLSVAESDEWIRLSNQHTGISIRKTLHDGEGPIEAIRLNSGTWVGDSQLAGLPAATEFHAAIVARGPVVAEVLCCVKSGARSWEVRFSLHAFDHVVGVDEAFSLGSAAALTLDLSQNFSPEHVLYRHGKGAVGTLATWRIADDPEPVFVLEPWLRWWERLRQGRWFGLYHEDGPDVLAIAACNAATWVDPQRARSLQSSPQIQVARHDQNVVMTLPLEDGRRRWLIAAVDREASLEMLQGSDLCRAPLPQKHFIRHGDFPLDLLKDYIIDWPGDHDNYPRLLVRKADLPELRRAFTADPARLAQYVQAPVSPYTMDGPVHCFLGTGDAALGKHLAETAVVWLDEAVRMYCEQDALLSPGFAPHHQTSLQTALNLADAILGADILPPEVQRRLRGQIAFLGYTVNRADFWSPERGFSANPNMTTTIAAFQTTAACMIPSHPLAKTWLRNGLAELKDNQLDHWSDANGGWLEAPHYAMVSYDYLVGCLLMVRNAGLGDHLYDARMKQIIAWFAKISTPPDSRLAGHRHFPPIGNTYISEPSGEFAVLAYLWKDVDPSFASDMQWMHQQHGSPETPGIGGFFATLAGYRTVLRDESIPAVAPRYGSELFPETGIVLRNVFPSERETQLQMIAGANHDHYDKDSGSVTIWGKGRVVADDFGYYGYVTGEDHSMLMSPAAPDIERMQVQDFSTTPRLDYVRGQKLAWTRQIAFAKDPDPLGPNYFVFCDSLAAPADATWRLWLTCHEVTLRGHSAHAVGNEDVDSDVVFAMPAAVELSTQTISRTSGSGISPTGQQGPTTTTQTGVVAAVRGGDRFLVVVYPRLKNERQVVVTLVADGKAVKVETPAGTDYVFLSPQPFAFREGELSFDGTAGLIQMRADGVFLALGAAGRVAAARQLLESPSAGSD
jgi:hypothetical protein